MEECYYYYVKQLDFNGKELRARLVEKFQDSNLHTAKVQALKRYWQLYAELGQLLPFTELKKERKWGKSLLMVFIENNSGKETEYLLFGDGRRDTAFERSILKSECRDLEKN